MEQEVRGRPPMATSGKAFVDCPRLWPYQGRAVELDGRQSVRQGSTRGTGPRLAGGPVWMCHWEEEGNAG